MNEKDLKILEQYDKQIVKTCRGRGSYICDAANHQCLLLKEYEASENRAETILQVLLTVMEDQRLSVDVFVRNKQGRLVSRDREEQGFILKEWRHGRECDVKKEDEILYAVEYLARLHTQLQMIQDIDLHQRQMTCMEEFKKRIRELKRIQNYVNQKKSKTEFEQNFMSELPRYYEEAKAAEEKAAKIKTEPLQLCHGDYTQHNILIGEDGIFIVNFDKCHYGSQMEDLYLFMRKILEKYDWDVDLGLNMIERYHAFKKISDEQRQELYLRFSFPEKFWKIANHYYNSKKVWGVGRNLNKLEKLTKQTQMKQQFLDQIKY